MTKIYVERESESSTSRHVTLTQQLRDDRQIVVGANCPLITRTDNIQAVVDGIAFYVFKVFPTAAPLDQAASINFLITTAPNQPVGIGFKAEAGGDAEVYIYENCTDVVGGDIVVPFNRNRASTKTPVTGVLYNPTSLTLGTLIYAELVLGGTGGNAAGATAESDYAFLKADTSYLFRMTNVSNQARIAEFAIQWVENG